MFKLIAPAAVLLAAATVANAADLPLPVVAPEPAPVVSEWNWSGIYGGLHGGYSWGESDADDGIAPATIDDFDGGLVGGQVGVNWQWNWVVLGVEADGTYAMAEGDAPFGIGTLDLETEWTASIRGRLGVAFNRFLVYGTGGAAWAHIDADEFGVLGRGGGVVVSDDQTHFGYVVGGGVEMMATRNITIGVEYLHSEFDDESYDLINPTDIDYDQDVVRGRVNVKFNSLFGG